MISVPQGTAGLGGIPWGCAPLPADIAPQPLNPAGPKSMASFHGTCYLPSYTPLPDMQVEAALTSSDDAIFRKGCIGLVRLLQSPPAAIHWRWSPPPPRPPASVWFSAIALLLPGLLPESIPASLNGCMGCGGGPECGRLRCWRHCIPVEPCGSNFVHGHWFRWFQIQQGHPVPVVHSPFQLCS